MSTTVPERLDALPTLVWNLCDTLFGQLRTDFHAPAVQYLELAKERIRTLLGQETRTLPMLDATAHAAVNTESARIRDALLAAGIDLTVAHLRSRRVPEQSQSGWLRVASGSLYDKHPDTIDGTLSSWRLLQSAFENAKRPGGIVLQFMADEASNLATETPDLVMPLREWRPLVDAIRKLRSSAAGAQIDAAALLDVMPQEAVSVLSLRIGRFWADHLDAPVANHANVAALIESTVVTLSLLATDAVSAPRSVLLVPVFVGQERVGGFSFFSASAEALHATASKLEAFARVLALYFATRESRELEVQSRLLEQLTPVTHLFIHTFNKAFTTPVLNLADDISSIAARMPDSDASASADSDRLEAISVFLRAFARRWAGTFPALQFMSTVNGELGSSGPRFLVAPTSVIDTEDLAEHLRALFALYLSNDVTDDLEFGAYSQSLTRMDALDSIVDLRFDLPDAVPGYNDIWLLHLLNLAQNAIEALPLRHVLEKYRQYPALMTPAFHISMRSKLETDDVGAQWLNLYVANNGQRFIPSLRDDLNELLLRFCSPVPATLWEIHMANRSNPQRYSTKSGEAYGSGLASLADYVSRICRVQVRDDRAESAEVALQQGEIIGRGSVRIVDNTGEDTQIAIRVPVGRTSGMATSCVVCLERR